MMRFACRCFSFLAPVGGQGIATAWASALSRKACLLKRSMHIPTQELVYDRPGRVARLWRAIRLGREPFRRAASTAGQSHDGSDFQPDSVATSGGHRHRQARKYLCGILPHRADLEDDAGRGAVHSCDARRWLKRRGPGWIRRGRRGRPLRM